MLEWNAVPIVGLKYIRLLKPTRSRLGQSIRPCDYDLFVACIFFGFRFPTSQPHPRRVLTTFGVTAAVKGTRTKMKLLWIAYASAS